jgi:hypothetical protein
MNPDMNGAKFLPWKGNRRYELEMKHAQPRLWELALRVPDLRRSSHPFARGFGEARVAMTPEAAQDVNSEPYRAKGARSARTAQSGLKTARARRAAKRTKGTR